VPTVVSDLGGCSVRHVPHTPRQSPCSSFQTNIQYLLSLPLSPTLALYAPHPCLAKATSPLAGPGAPMQHACVRCPMPCPATGCSRPPNPPLRVCVAAPPKTLPPDLIGSPAPRRDRLPRFGPLPFASAINSAVAIGTDAESDRLNLSVTGRVPPTMAAQCSSKRGCTQAENGYVLGCKNLLAPRHSILWLE